MVVAVYVKRQYVAADPPADKSVSASVTPSEKAAAEPMVIPVVAQLSKPLTVPPADHQSLPPTKSVSAPSEVLELSLKSKLADPFDQVAVAPPDGAIVTDQVGVPVGFSIQSLAPDGAMVAVDVWELNENAVVLKERLGLETSVTQASLVMRRFNVPSDMV